MPLRQQYLRYLIDFVLQEGVDIVDIYMCKIIYVCIKNSIVRGDCCLSTSLSCTDLDEGRGWIPPSRKIQTYQTQLDNLIKIGHPPPSE